MSDQTYVEHQSSNVHSSAYDPETRKLYVKFHNGGHYVYHGVDPHHHQAMQDADSVGSYLHQNIKPCHGCEKLEG